MQVRAFCPRPEQECGRAGRLRHLAFFGSRFGYLERRRIPATPANTIPLSSRAQVAGSGITMGEKSSIKLVPVSLRRRENVPPPDDWRKSPAVRLNFAASNPVIES